MNETPEMSGPWYRGITAYQWLVLLIASLGWIFDVFEGQVFVASMQEAMPALVPRSTDAATISFYNQISLAMFLLGGALGGIVFGVVSDRIGRTRTMVLTILVYSLFTCVTALAQTWWQMALLRFVVALGVGGEWAVASAMVAEVFPPRARAWSGAIFHSSSVLGTYLAVLVGALVVGNPRLGANGWRWAFALGALPALLTLWIRWKLREPEAWEAARQRAQDNAAQKTGRLGDLFAGRLFLHTAVGVTLAAVGLATFWGVHIYGKNTLRAVAEQRIAAETAPTDRDDAAASGRIKRAEMLGMFLVTTGGGCGLIMFGPLCGWLGRRAAFSLYHLGGLIVGPALFWGYPGHNLTVLYLFLPVFGFWTLGMHAGYAIYFPELYPTRLRATGTGFCFNAGRILAAPVLLGSGWLQKELGISLFEMAARLSGLFALGLLVLLLAPETKGRDLPQ